MATTIKLKNGSGAPLAGDLVQGEPALDLTNKRLYTEDSGGTVIEVGTNPTSLTTGTFTSTGIDDNATSTAITIDSSENVLINNTSFGSLGQVVIQQSADNKGIGIVDSTASNTFTIENNAASCKFHINTAKAITFSNGSGDTECMRIDSSGNVGIGGTPTATLDLFRSSGYPTIKINATGGASGWVSLQHGVTTGTSWLYSSGALNLGSGGTAERVTINSSGNVGIGTTSPTSKLEIQDTGSVGITIHSVDNATGNDAVLYFQRGTNETWGADLYQDFRIRNTVGALLFEYAQSGSTSEAMRIDSSGNLLVGRTSTGVSTSSFGFEVQSNGFVANSRNVTGANGVWQAFGNQGRAQVMGDGDLQNTNNSYGAISDERLKSNIVDASSQIDDIMAVQVRSYTLNETGATHIGVVAQELEASGMSGLVKTDAEGMKSVKYSILYLKAIKALQEAVTRIETLEAEVAALKGAN